MAVFVKLYRNRGVEGAMEKYWGPNRAFWAL